MQVVTARGRQHSNAARAASAVAAAVMAALALFEAVLVAGLPWGAAAWGGGQAVLSPGMRLASAGAALIWTAGQGPPCGSSPPTRRSWSWPTPLLPAARNGR